MGLKVKRAGQGGSFSFKLLTSGGLGLVRLLAHLGTNELKRKHVPCPALFNFELDISRFKARGV